MFIALFCFGLGILFWFQSDDYDYTDKNDVNRSIVGWYHIPQFALLAIFMCGVGIYHLIYSVDW